MTLTFCWAALVLLFLNFSMTATSCVIIAQASQVLDKRILYPAAIKLIEDVLYTFQSILQRERFWLFVNLKFMPMVSIYIVPCAMFNCHFKNKSGFRKPKVVFRLVLYFEPLLILSKIIITWYIYLYIIYILLYVYSALSNAILMHFKKKYKTQWKTWIKVK